MAADLHGDDIMPFGIDDILIGLAVSAASTGIGAAVSPGAPQPASYGKAAAAETQADIDTLALRRQIEAASRLGTKGVASMKGAPIFGKYNPKDWEPGGKYYGKPELLVNGKPNLTKDGTGRVWIGNQSNGIPYDFTGVGEIDSQADYAKQMAQVGIDLQKKYGVPFAEESARQLELADPEGAAARKLLFSEVKRIAEQQPERKLAKTLGSQVRQDLAAGTGLNSGETAALERTLMLRQARGDAQAADVGAMLTRGEAGAARLAGRQQKALGYQTSGVSPEDADYRKTQQDMSNMGAFLSGTTPTAQFQQLSGAQQGAAPMKAGAPLTNVGGNTGSGANFAQNQFSTQSALANNTANDWFGMLGLALKGAGAYAQAA